MEPSTFSPASSPGPEGRVAPAEGRGSSDEWTLLCERCGYVLEGLAGGGRCPECGLPIEASRPEARAGTPWQSGQSIGTWARTGWLVLRHPVETVEAMRIETRGSIELSWINAVVTAALLWVAPMSAAAAFGRAARELMIVPSAIVFAPIVLLGGPFVIRFLTWVEERGVRFFGARRGSRITPAWASTVCAHASYGWVLGGLLFAVGLLGGLTLHEWLYREQLGAMRAIVVLSPVWMPAAGLVAGLMSFETLTWVGVTRRRFANRERAAADGAGGERDAAGSVGGGE